MRDAPRSRRSRCTLSKVPQPARQAIFQTRALALRRDGRVRRRDRGGARAHARSAATSSTCVPVEGQADILVTGIPYISPYNVNSFLNPLLVQVMANGLPVQPVQRRAAREEGRHDDHHASVHRQVRQRAPRSVHRVRAPPAARDARRDRAAQALRGEVRDEPGVHPDVPHRPRLPPGSPVLHVVLGRGRPPAHRAA